MSRRWIVAIAFALAFHVLGASVARAAWLPPFRCEGQSATDADREAYRRALMESARQLLDEAELEIAETRPFYQVAFRAPDSESPATSLARSHLVRFRALRDARAQWLGVLRERERSLAVAETVIADVAPLLVGGAGKPEDLARDIVERLGALDPTNPDMPEARRSELLRGGVRVVTRRNERTYGVRVRDGEWILGEEIRDLAALASDHAVLDVDGDIVDVIAALRSAGTLDAERRATEGLRLLQIPWFFARDAAEAAAYLSATLNEVPLLDVPVSGGFLGLGAKRLVDTLNVTDVEQFRRSMLGALDGAAAALRQTRDRYTRADTARIHELVDLPVVRQIVLDRSERFTAVDCIVANEVTGRDVLNISLMVGGAAIGVVGSLVGGPEVGAAVLAASASLALGATATVLAYLDYKTLERTFHARGLSPSMVDQAAVAAAHTAFRWSAAALVVDGVLSIRGLARFRDAKAYESFGDAARGPTLAPARAAPIARGRTPQGSHDVWLGPQLGGNRYARLTPMGDWSLDDVSSYSTWRGFMGQHPIRVPVQRDAARVAALAGKWGRIRALAFASVGSQPPPHDLSLRLLGDVVGAPPTREAVRLGRFNDALAELTELTGLEVAILDAGGPLTVRFGTETSVRFARGVRGLAHSHPTWAPAGHFSFGLTRDKTSMIIHGDIAAFLESGIDHAWVVGGKSHFAFDFAATDELVVDVIQPGARVGPGLVAPSIIRKLAIAVIQK